MHFCVKFAQVLQFSFGIVPNLNLNLNLRSCQIWYHLIGQDLVGMRCKQQSVKHACVLWKSLCGMTLQHMQTYAVAKVVGVCACNNNHEICLHAKNSCKINWNLQAQATASKPKTLSCLMTLAQV